MSGCDFLCGFERRSGTVKAANGATVIPIAVVGRIDVGGAVEVEVVGVGAVRVRGRRPVVTVVAGVSEQVAVLIDDAAPLSTRALGSIGWARATLGLLWGCSTSRRSGFDFGLAVTKGNFEAQGLL